MPVACRIVLRFDRSFGFAVGAHDAARPLVIDPTREFTFTVGGNASVSTTDVATDSQGDTYLTGSTRASDFAVAGGIVGALGLAFEPRPMANLAQLAPVYLFAPTDGGPVRGRYLVSFINTGPDEAGDVVLTVSLPCARLRDLPVTPQLRILRQPAAGEPITEIVLARETPAPVRAGTGRQERARPDRPLPPAVPRSGGPAAG